MAYKGSVRAHQVYKQQHGYTANKSITSHEVMEMKACSVDCTPQKFPDRYNFCPCCGGELIASEVRGKRKQTKPGAKKQIELDVKTEIELENIIGGMKCPKDFKCYRSGFENLCKAKDIGIETVLECQEENPQDCKFSSSFGNSYFCTCPLRVFIAKKLKK